MAAGHEHTIALSSIANIWAWGNNRSNQIGLQTRDFVLLPEQCKGFRGLNTVAVCGGAGHSLILAVGSKNKSELYLSCIDTPRSLDPLNQVCILL